MQDVRCRCDKLVSKIQGDKVVIKCRHCKRFVVIKAQKIEKIEYSEMPKARVQRI